MHIDVLTFFNLYSFWIIFFGVMLDNAGLPIPGEIFLLAAGAFIGMGKMDFEMAVLSSVSGAIIGDSLSYYMGRWGGKRIIDLYCKSTLCTSLCSNRIEAFYTRFGNVTIPMARFVMGVRTLAAPLAGAIRVAYIKFLILDIIGATVWTIIFLFTGLIFKNSILELIPLFEKVRYGFILGIAGIIAVFVLFKIIRRRFLGRPDMSKMIRRLKSHP